MLRRLAVLMALVAFGGTAHAQLWTWSFMDKGVDYSLSFDSLSGNVGTFTLTLDTTGYNQQPNGYLDSVDLKAWGGTDISFTLLSAPGGTAWNPTEGPISSGPVVNTGCGGTLDAAGFACVEAVTKGVLSVADGDPYSFRFEVTASSFHMTSTSGSHVGAGYASAAGEGSSFGITSVTSPIPEPETYAMLLAGLAVLGFATRRRRATMAAAA